jgi:septal ring-binding cell division protein DamX
VISGSGHETLLIRADGPSLTQFGVAGVLAQPTLSIYNSAGAVVASNTGWGTSSNATQIASTAASLGAFAFASGSADSALLVILPAGSYTVQIAGLNSTTGVALAEIYEVSSGGTRLENISTRAQVGTGPNIIIPGFVISGTGSEKLLVRGDGPGLTQFGVTGVLTQPSISLYNSAGNVIASNTAWGTNSSPAQITSADSQVGAFALTAGSADSALVTSLPPGAYTLQLSGVNGLTGDALAELYETQ